MPRMPSIVLSSTGHRQTKAMIATFIELPTPITTIASGSSAGGGIARRNSTIGAAARRAVSLSPSGIPDQHRDRRRRGSSRRVSRSRLGTTSLPTRSNTHVSLNVSRISVSGG